MTRRPGSGFEGSLPLLLIFSISLALLVDEIMLSAIFHVLLGAGNTVAAVAIALIGLSASGVAAFLIPAFGDPTRSRSLAQATSLAFAVCLMASAMLVMAIPVSHGELIYSRDELRVQLLRLLVYHLAVIPFFVGGLAINVLLRSQAHRISRLYFADLAGAAFGCLASPFLLSALGASRAVVYAALPVVFLSGWLALRERTRRRALLLLPVALVGIDLSVPGLHSFVTLNTMGDVRAPEYRSFSISPGDLEFEKWALDAWTIIRSERIPQQWEDFEGWGLSPRYQGPIPRIKLINYNARFSTYVTEYDGDFDPLAAWLDADLGSFHFQLGRPFDRVLNIGAGGGREVLNALHHGAKQVTAVDVSKVVIDEIMQGHLGEFSGGLYLDPRVNAVAAEGRNFAERTRDTFDLVDFSIVGGMNLEKMDLVRVDDLFTLEALSTYLSRLSENGLFSYLMYTTRSDLVEAASRRDVLAQPLYVPALRTLTGLRMAFESAWPELDFRDHLLVAGLPGLISPHYDLVHIVVSRPPIQPAERRRFLELCEALDFVVFHPVGGSSEGSNPYADLATTGDLESYAEALPFSVLPARDDRPFQYTLDGPQLRRAAESGALLEVVAGFPLISLAVRIGTLALLVTAAPLVVLAARRRLPASGLRDVRSLLALFACIGFAYMAVEIAVLLKLQFYLGNPVYGLSVGLFAFLLSSSIGSYLSGSFPEALLANRARIVVAWLLVVGIAFYGLSSFVFSETLAAPLFTRALIAVGIIFPLALPMGMLFPIGIRLLSRHSDEWIPWAWAINGCFSILGIFGSRITALLLGFSRTLLLGLCVYAVVVACIAAASARPQRVEPPT